MIGLIQRVTSAEVRVEGKQIGKIEHGLLVLVGVEATDKKSNAERMRQRLLGYRIFSDQQGKMNLNVQQTLGGLLLVPQFTLVADTSKGMRPSFSRGASPEHGQKLFDYLVDNCREHYDNIATGRFGADMDVSLCNQGPVTFWLQS